MPAAEACRLYLISPSVFDPAGFADTLAAALDAGDVACLRLQLDGDDDAIQRATDLLVPICQARDTAFLLTGRPHLIGPTGADGVHVDGSIEGLRASMPADTILGAGCGQSRHDALVAGELEADYVSFAPWGNETADIVTWWNQMVVLPSVVEGITDTIAASQAIQAGADFLCLHDGVWGDPAGVGQAIAAFDAVIAKPQDH